MHAPLPPSKGSRCIFVLFRVQTFFGTSCQQSKAAEKQTIIGNKNISHKRKQTSHKTQISSWIVGGRETMITLADPMVALVDPPTSNDQSGRLRTLTPQPPLPQARTRSRNAKLADVCGWSPSPRCPGGSTRQGPAQHEHVRHDEEEPQEEAHPPCRRSEAANEWERHGKALPRLGEWGSFGR